MILLATTVIIARSGADQIATLPEPVEQIPGSRIVQWIVDFDPVQTMLCGEPFDIGATQHMLSTPNPEMRQHRDGATRLS